jgi:large subunit ribosomal protein L6e
MPKLRNTVTRTGPRYLFKADDEPKREGKYYPAEDVPKPRKRAFKPGTAKLRSSIKPGSVLILLAGRFRGRRVVFLKQLASGLLLVTGASPCFALLGWRPVSHAQAALSSVGPFGVNGVPLRRVNQAYVIATSTQVDIKGVKVPESVNDEFFKASEEEKKKGEADFMALKTAKATGASEERKRIQTAVDAAVKLTADLKAYLKSRFALSKGDLPHAMKF